MGTYIVLVEVRRITSDALTMFDELMSDPNVTFTGLPIFSVWGRRACRRALSPA